MTEPTTPADDATFRQLVIASEAQELRDTAGEVRRAVARLLDTTSPDNPDDAAEVLETLQTLSRSVTDLLVRADTLETLGKRVARLEAATEV